MLHLTPAQCPLPDGALRDLITQIVYDNLPFKTNGYSIPEVADTIQYSYAFGNFDEQMNFFKVHPTLWRDGNGFLTRLIHIRYDSDYKGTTRSNDTNQKYEDPRDVTAPTAEAWVSCARKLRQILAEEGMQNTIIEICDISWFGDKPCCMIFAPREVQLFNLDTVVNSDEAALNTEPESMKHQSQEHLQASPTEEHKVDKWENEFLKYKAESCQLCEKLKLAGTVFLKKKNVAPLSIKMFG
ncbi:hypothetical protein HD806DRAFT_552421 [Xylariaceae sp. AK1471]|nr:hypothetical protein HD806DRAFT_552421 [Xylariaceae sp. AK1471]